MTSPSRRQAASDRRRLIDTLRRQSRAIGGRFFTREAAPELFDLAIEAKYQRGRTMLFRGIRFPLKYGWHVYVCDPETSETLIGAGGLL
ncbi:hypothetical protein MASR1M60_14980 [Rhodocyclaceae bacterium]